jgi:hypothetical protein
VSGQVAALASIGRCSCGSWVARDAGVDPRVCPHLPGAAAAAAGPAGALLHGPAFRETVRALHEAAAWLAFPCTDCTCPRAAVTGFDPDPDCPGLTVGGNGCRVDTRVRARAALASVGIHSSTSSRRVERRTVTAALAHVQTRFTAPPWPALTSEVITAARTATLTRRTA